VQESPKAERATDILARARAAGFEVSERQLERWHQAGLIPRPVQTWTEGQPRSSALYPAGSGDQLIMLCIIRQNLRRSNDIGWSLWWLGFLVDEKYWMGPLRALATLYDKKLATEIMLSNREGRLSNLRTHRTSNVLFRQLRKRLGPRDFEILIAYVGEIIGGRFEGWSVSFDSREDDVSRDKTAIRKALRSKARRKAESPADNCEFDSNIESTLVLLSSRLGDLHFLDILCACSNEHLFRARNQLRCLFTAAQFFARPAKSTISDSVNGLYDLFRQYALYLKPSDQGLFLLLFLMLKEDTGFDQKIYDAINSFIGGMSKEASPEINKFLRRIDPALADLLSGEFE
jgi:hypothetical protein